MKTEIRAPGFVVPSGYDLELALASVGAGWAELIKQVFTFMETIKEPVKIVQVKEKWGGLRIYTDCMNEKMDNFITRMERHSFSICEACGKKGALYKRGGWYFTSCDEHAGDALIVDGGI